MSYIHIEDLRRFKREYHNGLDRNNALPLLNKVVEGSLYADKDDSWFEGKLRLIDSSGRPFQVGGRWVNYIRTCQKTYARPHPIITIGGVELPRPETKKPKICATIWIWKPGSVTEHVWQDYCNQISYLKAGRVHLTENRAQEWADWWQQTVMATVRGR